MAALLESWTGYRVSREDNISSILIGPKLGNDKNIMEKPKFDNVEEDQVSVLLRKWKK